MRIAFVSILSRSPWGASEVLWAQAAQLALQEGHQVFVSTFGWPQLPTQLAELERRGAQLNLRSHNRWSRRSALISRLARTFKPLEEFRPDAICLSQGGTYDIARGGSIRVLRNSIARLGVPYILLCHCEQPAPPKRHLQAARETFAHSAVVGFLADKLRSLSEAHLNMTIKNARNFHNPVNLSRIELLPWPVDSSLKLAFVGRLEAVKNPALLIDVLGGARWCERDWCLTMYGAGPHRESLERRVREMGLSERIRFAGHVDDIAEIWAAHHALIMPSRLEGVPLAMIEAMLCGRPVVATDIGGISEWLEDRRSGFLIAHPAAAQLDTAMEQLWQRRAHLEAMGRYAHEHTIAKRDADPARTLLQWLVQARTHATRSGNVYLQAATP